MAVQVLGSGGPELQAHRAAPGYVVWHRGRARVLVDTGPGSARRFSEAGGRFTDIRYILLSHLHVDHSADLPTYIKSSYFTGRAADLRVYGPSGNEWLPPATRFVQTLFGSRGAYPYLSDYLDGRGAYRILAQDVDAQLRTVRAVRTDADLTLRAVAVHHGPIPALAWRVEIAGRVLVFSGDLSGTYGTLATLAHKADLLIAHHAIPEQAGGVARRLHMPPSAIGRVARDAGVARLVLAHRMSRTLGREAATRRHIRAHYDGPLFFADDLDCFPVPPSTGSR